MGAFFVFNPSSSTMSVCSRAGGRYENPWGHIVCNVVGICPLPRWVVNLNKEGDSLKFCVDNGHFIGCLPNSKKYWGRFFHLSCPPGQGAVFTYVFKGMTGVPEARGPGVMAPPNFAGIKREHKQK